MFRIDCQLLIEGSNRAEKFPSLQVTFSYSTRIATCNVHVCVKMHVCGPAYISLCVSECIRKSYQTERSIETLYSTLVSRDACISNSQQWISNNIPVPQSLTHFTNNKPRRILEMWESKKAIFFLTIYFNRIAFLNSGKIQTFWKQKRSIGSVGLMMFLSFFFTYSVLVPHPETSKHKY